MHWVIICIFCLVLKLALPSGNNHWYFPGFTADFVYQNCHQVSSVFHSTTSIIHMRSQLEHSSRITRKPKRELYNGAQISCAHSIYYDVTVEIESVVLSTDPRQHLEKCYNANKIICSLKTLQDPCSPLRHPEGRSSLASPILQPPDRRSLNPATPAPQKSNCEKKN